MQDRIEPPILISRLMTFVMATSLVVLAVLAFTLSKMFPLSRPQIFFLDTQDLADKELILTEIADSAADTLQYKQQFIKEYIRERNEIVPDLAVMRSKWANSDNGTVRVRSTDSVYGVFASTDMANIVFRDLDETFNISCKVDFPSNAAVRQKTGAQDTYVVDFVYDCYYGQNEDQKYRRKYTLQVKLQSTDRNAVKWARRMNNPLGVQVSEYKDLDGQGDPLNWISDVEE